MIVEDVNGEALILNSIHLSEYGIDEWFLNLADISEQATQKLRTTVPIWTKRPQRRVEGGDRRVTMPVTVGPVKGFKNTFQIGCHLFDRATYAQILRAAKAARKRLNAATKR